MKITEAMFKKIFGKEDAADQWYIFHDIFAEDVKKFKEHINTIRTEQWEKYFPLQSVTLLEGIGFKDSGNFTGHLTIKLVYADGIEERKQMQGTFTFAQKAEFETLEYWRSV